MPQVVKVAPGRYAAIPQLANAVTSLDGYVFAGMPYWDATGISAVGTWLNLLKDPNYASLPAVTSISVDVEVSGTVDQPPA